jgi:hypothetical protein
METKVIEAFGSIQTVSGQFRDHVDKDIWMNLLSENIIRDAASKGYSPVDKPEFYWDEQAFTYVDDGENGVSKVFCDASDNKALFNITCRLKVVKATQNQSGGRE